MSAIDLVSLRLALADDFPLRPAPHLLRGAIAGRFRDNPLLHQHEGDRCLYRYPRVQYRWDEQGPLLLGLGEGVQALVGVEWAGLELQLGSQKAVVRDAVCVFRRHEICPSSRLLRYRLAAPWLPLSQENYRRFRMMDPSASKYELDRLAVAGLLVGLRGFGVDFPGRLFAAFEESSRKPCRYKDVEMIGFRGHFVANVDLPDGFALGRAVSHGYGWVYREIVETATNEEPVHVDPSAPRR